MRFITLSLLSLGVRGFTVSEGARPRRVSAAALQMGLGDADRRTALARLGSTVFGASALSLGRPFISAAEAEEDQVDVYFGVGCFWHVQHEFVQAERRILGRSDDQLSAVAGYAGGATGKDASRPGTNNLVCYHNMQQIADYGRLGNGEVVGLRVPPSSVEEFAEEYFKLFDSKGDRPDKGDRGPEYRSLLGLPGGVDSKLFAGVEAAATRRGITLVRGSGSDPDTLGKGGKVWVMDASPGKFPFAPGEIYHQFHDGFMPGEDYPATYNRMGMAKYEAGTLKASGCPDTV